MKKLVIILFVFFLSNSVAKVITGNSTWKLNFKNNSIYGAFCNIRFDTDNYNYTYECKGVVSPDIIVYDINEFVVGVGYDNNRRANGFGTINHINGIPYSVGSRGIVLDTNNFIKCSYGYTQSSYNSEYCIQLPYNSLEGAYEGADYGYRCKTGYEDIDGECIKTCNYNQFLSNDVCVSIPKYAYKTVYNNYECNTDYEYYENSPQRCIKSCTENQFMDTTTYTCKAKYTKEFIKYCNVTFENMNEIVTCKDGYDWYYTNETQTIKTSKKLPNGALSFAVNGDIRDCADNYISDKTQNKCIPPRKPTPSEKKMYNTYCGEGNTTGNNKDCVDGYDWYLTDVNDYESRAAKKLNKGINSLWLGGEGANSCTEGYTLVGEVCVEMK